MANDKSQVISRRFVVSRLVAATWFVIIGLGAGLAAGHDPPPLPPSLGFMQQSPEFHPSPAGQHAPATQHAPTTQQMPATQPFPTNQQFPANQLFPPNRPFPPNGRAPATRHAPTTQYVPTNQAALIPSVPQLRVEIPNEEPVSESANTPSLEDLFQPSQASSSLRTIALLSVISLAPAIALMTTSYVRVAIVLTLLRQGLGAQGLPSNQMISALALFISAAVMSPVWTEVYDNAVVPYSDPDIGMPLDEALATGVKPVRKFMVNQIKRLHNEDDILLFYRYLPEGTSMPQGFDDVPLNALLPAFMLSELKTAFLIGFQVYLPFLILDILVASVTVSMGMFMLPPAYVSLPFKLLLFVMVDGWHLLVEMLLKSFVV